MDAVTARTVGRLAGVAVLAMIVAAFATIGASMVLDRVERPEILIADTTPEPIVAHIDGAVATPGVYTVPAGARLADVIEAAGGLRGDADAGSVNLAARIGDGEAIDIPADAPEVFASPAPTARAGSRININSADQAVLETLPGIGPVLAERIIAERDRNGPFASVDALDRVEGISDATVQDLRPLVTTSD